MSRGVGWTETDVVQREAERVHRETGAPFVIVLTTDMDTMRLGAWCPDADYLRRILHAAIDSMDSGKAKVIDRRGHRV
jgi:hypothetical protein